MIDWKQIDRAIQCKKHKLSRSKRLWNLLKENTPISDVALEHDFLMQLAIEVNYDGSARLMADVLEQVREYKRWLELRFPDWSLDYDPSNLADNSYLLDPFPELQIK